MGHTAFIEKKHDKHLKVVSNLGELLKGKTYAMLGDQTIVYENDKGKYVIFTIDPNAHYTKEDFMQLPEGAPFELLNGKLTFMPSPFDPHQNASSNLHISLGAFIKQHKLGVIRAAPLDVHLDEENIFQPDLFFVAKERTSIIKKWVFGPPDLVVEIHSKSTKKSDLNTKYKQYEKHGVPEYWMVDTESKTVKIYVLKGKKYVLKGEYKEGSKLASNVVNGFEMAIDDIFEVDI